LPIQWLGKSRTPVRQALIHLQEEGLVQIALTPFGQAHRVRMFTLPLRTTPVESTRDHHEQVQALKSRDTAAILLGARGLVTCVDKSNVFVSYVFFRKIFDEVAAKNLDIERGYSYVDAMALDMVRRPWYFDVLVAENMFADILSDLGGGIVCPMEFLGPLRYKSLCRQTG
jgi:hypothetical protein